MPSSAAASHPRPATNRLFAPTVRVRPPHPSSTCAFRLRSVFRTVDVCSRSTGLRDLTLDAREADGRVRHFCGPCVGCSFGCLSFWCCCRGCRALYFDVRAEDATLEVSGVAARDDDLLGTVVGSAVDAATALSKMDTWAIPSSKPPTAAPRDRGDVTANHAAVTVAGATPVDGNVSAQDVVPADGATDPGRGIRRAKRWTPEGETSSACEVNAVRAAAGLEPARGAERRAKRRTDDSGLQSLEGIGQLEPEAAPEEPTRSLASLLSSNTVRTKPLPPVWKPSAPAPDRALLTRRAALPPLQRKR